MPHSPIKSSTQNTVLIIENDQPTSKVFAKMLAKHCDVTVTFTHQQKYNLLPLVKSGAIDLLLINISLFEDGEERLKMVRRLKSDPKTAHLPIILLTAHAMDDQQASCLARSGANYCFLKPILDYQAFFGTLKGLLASPTPEASPLIPLSA